MAGNKTVATDASVSEFLAGVQPDVRRADAAMLIDMLTRISGAPPKLWGPSIIGFGTHHYVYDSGREGDMARIAFSPRKAELVLYVGATTPNIAELLPTLGKHRTGKGCLYVKTLADVDLAVLEQVVARAFANRSA